MLRPFQDAHVIGDFSGQLADSRASPTLVDGRPAFQIQSANGEWTSYRVDYTIGSKWQQAYATTREDGRIVVFPLQFRARDARWLNYWAAVDEPGSARARHRTLSRGAGAGRVSDHVRAVPHESADIHGGQAVAAAASFREPGVNCEMCHGPSLAHADRRKAGTPSGAPPRATPVRFREIAPAQSVAICAQCHAQSAVHDAAEGGAVNYATRGEWYRSYRSHLFSAFPKSAFYRDGRFRATTFISESFARSRCYREGGATCATCHNPHPSDAATNPTSLKTAGESDEMCLTCHARVRAAPERHTRHRAGSEASRCVTCHMPRIQEALLFSARSHQIDDIPDAEMTARFGPAGAPTSASAAMPTARLDGCRRRCGTGPRAEPRCGHSGAVADLSTVVSGRLRPILPDPWVSPHLGDRTVDTYAGIAYAPRRVVTRGAHHGHAAKEDAHETRGRTAYRFAPGLVRGSLGSGPVRVHRRHRHRLVGRHHSGRDRHDHAAGNQPDTRDRRHRRRRLHASPTWSPAPTRSS